MKIVDNLSLPGLRYEDNSILVYDACHARKQRLLEGCVVQSRP